MARRITYKEATAQIKRNFPPAEIDAQEKVKIKGNWVTLIAYHHVYDVDDFSLVSHRLATWFNETKVSDVILEAN